MAESGLFHRKEGFGGSGHVCRLLKGCHGAWGSWVALRAEPGPLVAFRFFAAAYQSTPKRTGSRPQFIIISHGSGGQVGPAGGLSPRSPPQLQLTVGWAVTI